MCGNNEGWTLFRCVSCWRRTFYFGKGSRVLAKGEKIFGVLAGVAALISGIVGIASAVTGHRVLDLGCDWYCDNCGAKLNDQAGFIAGSSWTCSQCGYFNDVSTDNIVSSYSSDDGSGHLIDVVDVPAPGDYEDPEDY